MASTQPDDTQRPKAGPALAARLILAVCAPLVLLLAVELTLRLAGYGRASTFLIPDEKPGYLRTNPEFASLFLPGSFDLRPLNLRIAERKPENTIRVVVLGGSAAQGVPVPSFGFAPQLRAQLRRHYPGKDVEVIDAGIVAVNSHVVYQIAQEMGRISPDLFVVYMGNNEVVGPYGPGCAYLSEMPPLWVIRASVFVRSTRTGQFVADIVGRLAGRGRKRAEWGGMSMFVNSAVRGDDPRLNAVYRNFVANLRGIIGAASACGAQTVLCTVAANLKDCPPFLSLHRAGMTADEMHSWQSAFESGRLAWRLGELDSARRDLGEALSIDPQYAETLFMLGSVDEASGDTAAARGRFMEALHWDALRFRPDSAINSVIRQVAQGRSGVTLVDVARELGADPRTSAPICGRELMFEHVHFDWPGNVRAARLIAEGCASALGGGSGAWLDADGCAAALAYGPHERLPMLLRIEVLVRKPPFTNQLTHVADEAAMARDISNASKLAQDPAVAATALGLAQAAIGADPLNPALYGVLEGVDLDRNDAEGALAASRRAAELLPRDVATDADEASILIRLGRYPDAGAILDKAAHVGADLDTLLPVLEAYWTRAGKRDEGLAFLSRAIAGRPNDPRLKVIDAALRRGGGDAAGAELMFRDALADDPANEDALEGLVALLDDSGRAAEAEKECLAAARAQPRNQANDLRAASASEVKGDDPEAISFLQAAELAGPVNATFELSLALKLYKAGRTGEMMTHLALARGLSLGEGNPSVTSSIDSLVARLRPSAP